MTLQQNTITPYTSNFLKNKKSFLFVILFLYTFCALVSNLNFSFTIFAYILMLIPCIFLDTNMAISSLLYEVCFSGCFKNNGLFITASTYGLLILLIKTIIPVFKTDRKKLIPLLAVFLFYITSLICSICMSACTYFGIIRFTNLTVCLSLATMVKKADLQQMLKYLSCGIILSILLSFLYYTGLSTPQPFMGENYLRFGGCFININSLGMYCSLGLACSVSLFLQKEISNRNFAFYSITFLGCGLLSFSKTFMLITLCTMCITFIYLFIKCENKRKFFIRTICCLIIVAILLAICHNLVANIVDRFVGDKISIGNITTGRSEIWKEYFKTWTKNIWTILFGVGACHPYLVIDDLIRSPHNIYLGLLTQLGVVGIIALIAVIIVLFRNKQFKKSFICYLPIISCLLNGLTEDYQNSLHTCLPILICVLFMFNTEKVATPKQNEINSGEFTSQTNG